jgi:hypothetical protein
MNCQAVLQNLSLYLYGELAFQQEEEFEQHIGQCPVCREALERERRVHSALDAEECQPSMELLLACRRDLQTAVVKTQSRRLGWWDRVSSILAIEVPLRVVGAMALIAIGFFGARLWRPEVESYPGATVRLRALEQAPRGGGLQLVLEEVRERTMRGDPADEQVREMLVLAAREASDPDLRAVSVDALKEHCEQFEVRSALLRALRKDPDSTVRLKALDALRPFAGDSDTRKALAEVLLADENPAIRTAAIDLLVANMSTDAIGTLQELMLRESNPDIRQKGLNALRQVNASVETF